jgi:hypothetical protein
MPTASTAPILLARYLYVYVNKAPSKDMDKLASEFITFVLLSRVRKSRSRTATSRFRPTSLRKDAPPSSTTSAE